MTMPAERTNAVRMAREFLLGLLDTSKHKHLNPRIRGEAYRILKHYPGNYELQQLAKKFPKEWGKIYEDNNK